MEQDRWLIYDHVQVECEYEQNTYAGTLLFAFPVFVNLQCHFNQHIITKEKTTWLLIRSRWRTLMKF